MTKVTINKTSFNPRCAACAYWSQVQGTVGLGQCRRLPPTPMYEADGRIKAMWPITQGVDWCGEHAVVELVAHEPG